MKLYKLKEEAKVFIADAGDVLTKEQWFKKDITLNALEEVHQRIKLNVIIEDCKEGVYRTDGELITTEQRVLMEKALNGELIDFDKFELWANGRLSEADYKPTMKVLRIYQIMKTR